MSHLAVLLFSVVMIDLGAIAAYGQEYPNKPIRIVTSNAGGGSDFASRLVGQGISGPLGQQVIVENRPSGIFPGEVVAKAPADGYTLLLAGASHWIGPLMQDASYDAIRDFAPVTLVLSVPNILVVHPSLPVKSVNELIALAKARPGALNYATSGSGGAPHLAAELFKSMAGVNIVRINYKGTGPAVNDLTAGQVQLMVPTVPSAASQVKSGRLRALGVTSLQPSALMPGVPTVAATLPGYNFVGILGIFAPAKTPSAIINRLNQEIVRILNRGDVKEKFLNTGSEVVGSSPPELAAAVKSEITVTGKLIKDLGIKAE